jgi:hypothetical protein
MRYAVAQGLALALLFGVCGVDSAVSASIVCFLRFGSVCSVVKLKRQYPASDQDRSMT